MDDSIESDSASWDADAFEHWLEQMAESRGVSNEEVLNQLASSLWVLDELETLVDETDIHSEFPEGSEPRESTSTLESQLAALDERLEEFEARVAALEDDHDSLDDDVTEDIDNIEEVLRYLVDRTDTLSERVSTVSDRLEALETTVTDWEATREKLADLKAEASRQGISTAECEHCGNAVELATLARPECPACSHPFDSVYQTDGCSGSPTIGGRTREQSASPPPSSADSDAAGSDSPPSFGDEQDFESALAGVMDEVAGDAGPDGRPSDASTPQSDAQRDADGESDATSFEWKNV
jgi:uncharacterized coiled-coil protein SlyX